MDVMHDPRRVIPLSGAHNVRDLGGYDADGGAGARTQWRRFLRADGLHNLSAGDIDHLQEEGLRTVIDLRSTAERAAEPNPFEGIDEIGYHPLALFDALAPAGGRPAEAPKPADPLLEFYLTALHQRGAAIAAVMDQMAVAPEGAVLFHCTAGKDRTGIIAALLLSLAGTPEDQILADYAMTKHRIATLVAHFLQVAEAQGSDVAAYRPMLDCRPETMQAMLDDLRRHHGGATGYLGSIGLSGGTARSLHDRLVL